MLRVNSIKLPVGYKDEDLKNRIIHRLRISSDELLSVKPIRRSIDARDKDNIRYVLCVDVCVGKKDSLGSDIKTEKRILSDKRVKDVILS